jgi:hypothetical protein
MDSPTASLATETTGDGLNVSVRNPVANSTLETFIQGTVSRAQSSCIQCHNNAAMTTGKDSDFTYMLQRAR